MIPLVYVIRPEAEVPVAAPALAGGEPYLLEHGSVEQELVARASHTHALFREDNSDVYYKLEEATRGTPYAASIKPFKRTKQGREAWLAITGQYAGKDKWAAEIKRQEQLLHTRAWKGQSNFFPGEVHRPTSQCLCLDAGLCRAHPVPTAKWAQSS